MAPIDRFKLARVREHAKLSDAMLALEHSRAEIVLVVDGDEKLIGTMTDGDIRRALLKGATLDANVVPFMTTKFTAVSRETSRAQVLDYMQARRIGQIPIVDADGMLVGLHLLTEILGGVERSNWAVIMAGGRGTRLMPLTQTLPKPLIPIAGRPILEHIILHLVGNGVRTLFVSINYLGEMIEEQIGDGSRFGCRVEYLRETKPLGTGGPLATLPRLPSDPVLVMNGDLVTQANVGDLLDAHERGNCAITVGVKPYFHTIPYGCVELDNGRITELNEKPTLMRWVNAGIYAISPDEIARLPKEPFSMPWVVEQALPRGVGAYEIHEDWIDVGQRDQLVRAREGEPT
jgi:dTDP-glucose pyrophosphorylase/predicted transcriptional regulator